jgi:hypothetical protein
MWFNNLIGLIYVFFTKAKFYKERTELDSNGKEITVKIYTIKKFRRSDTRRGVCYANRIVVIETMKEDEKLFQHEFMHTMQYYREGILFFPRYFKASIKVRRELGKEYGYWKNKYEVEAREYARNNS